MQVAVFFMVLFLLLLRLVLEPPLFSNTYFMKKSLYVLIFLVTLLVAAVYYFWFMTPMSTPDVVTTVATSTPTLISTVNYSCQNNKEISASFYETAAVPTGTANSAPVTTATVSLTLSDGRTFNLTQTVSADGGRYANEGDVFVFWSKGNGALITENSAEKDFIGCVLVATDAASSALPAVYVDTAAQFSVRLPSLASTTSLGFVAMSTYTKEVASGTTAAGVKFTIPATIATGTNLSVDSFISVEKLAVTKCTGSSFGDNFGTSTTQTSIEGREYSVASTSDAGAGNRYEETIFALPGTSPCVAVRYFIHYTVLENYASGSVKAFDKTSLLSIFDQIRQSLVVNL